LLVSYEQQEKLLKNGKLLTVNDLTVQFRIGRRRNMEAVSGVSIDIGVGETLGLVGESGCGKSTIARSIVGLQKPTTGEIIFAGQDLSQCTNQQMKKIRPQIQMIFQDSLASLNPGRKIGKTIEEPLRVLGSADRQGRERRAHEMMQAVGLDPKKMVSRYPFEFSGGQCQRVSLARALILNPRLLICDEPVSALDVSVQAQILNLLETMKQQFELTILFISHDLAVVKNISDRVAVMYLGKICETAAAEDLYQSPRHPYSAMLIASVPEPNSEQRKREKDTINGEMPSPIDPPPGCRFHTRCPNAQNVCREVEPELAAMDNDGKVACHFPL
jgi:peptide/nickel transport system ATP-binding protein